MGNSFKYVCVWAFWTLLLNIQAQDSDIYSTDFIDNIMVLHPDANSIYCSKDTIDIQWVADSEGKVDISYSLDGINFIFIAEGINASEGNYKWISPKVTSDVKVVVMVKDQNGNISGVSAPFTLRSLPTFTTNLSGTMYYCSSTGLDLVIHSDNTYQYVWYLNGDQLKDTTSSITAHQPGRYEVSIRDESGCKTGLSTLVIKSPEAEAVILAPDSIFLCEGGEFILEAENVPNQTYQWLKNNDPIEGMVTRILTVTESGLYNIIAYTGDHGCADTSNTIYVSVGNNAAKPIIVSPTVYCKGEVVTTLEVEGANVFWYSDKDLEHLVHQGEVFDGLEITSNTVYYVTQKNEDCESEAVAVNIEFIPGPPKPYIEMRYTFCPGDTVGEITAIGENINWYSDEHLSNHVYSGNVFTPQNIDSDTSFFITQNVDGCESDVFEVKINYLNSYVPKPAVDTLVHVYCAQSVTITAFGTNINWYGDIDLQQSLHNGASITLENLHSDSIIYVTNSVGDCGVSDTIKVNVKVLSMPSPPVVNIPSVCRSSNITLHAIGENVHWYKDSLKNELLSSNSELPIRVENDTVFYFTQSINGCESEVKEVLVKMHPLSQVEIVNETGMVCEGDSVILSLTGQPQGVIKWYHNDKLLTGEESDRLVVTEGGKYVVWIQGEGCSIEKVVNIEFLSVPPRPVITKDGNVLVSSADEGNQWYINGVLIEGATSSTYVPQQSGQYTVQVTKSNGCTSLMSLPIDFVTTSSRLSEDKSNMLIYPNPNNGNFELSMDVPNNSSISLRIYDINGRTLMNEENQNISGKYYKSVSIRPTVPGLYIIEIMVNDEKEWFKLFVQ